MRRLMSASGKRVWRTPIPHLVPVRLRSGRDLLLCKKIPLEYTAVVFLAGLILSAKVMQQVLLHFVPVPVLPHIVAAGFGLYFLIVQSRLLGLMYYAKRSQLGWFNR